MVDVTDFTLYKNKAHLELCLDLVKDAYVSIRNGRYDYVEEQLNDILETFDRQELAKEDVSYRAEVYFINNKKKCQ
jgi:hypothetical protein